MCLENIQYIVTDIRSLTTKCLYVLLYVNFERLPICLQAIHVINTCTIVQNAAGVFDAYVSKISTKCTKHLRNVQNARNVL